MRETKPWKWKSTRHERASASNDRCFSRVRHGQVPCIEQTWRSPSKSDVQCLLPKVQASDTHLIIICLQGNVKITRGKSACLFKRVIPFLTLLDVSVIISIGNGTLNDAPRCLYHLGQWSVSHCRSLWSQARVSVLFTGITHQAWNQRDGDTSLQNQTWHQTRRFTKSSLRNHRNVYARGHW